MNWSDIDNPQEWIFTTPFPDLKQWKQINNASLILDVGCGYGRTLQYLSDHGYINLYGIDVSPRFVEQAKLNCPNAHLLVGDCLSIDSLFEQKFDVVLVMGVMEYILSDQEQREFCNKVKMILKTNGIAIFETFTMDIRANWIQYIFGVFRSGHWGVFQNSKGFLCHHQTISTLRRMFDSVFHVNIYTENKYKSWTNNIINGMTIIASNHELRPV